MSNYVEVLAEADADYEEEVNVKCSKSFKIHYDKVRWRIPVQHYVSRNLQNITPCVAVGGDNVLTININALGESRAVKLDMSTEIFVDDATCNFANGYLTLVVPIKRAQTRLNYLTITFEDRS